MRFLIREIEHAEQPLVLGLAEIGQDIALGLEELDITCNESVVLLPEREDSPVDVEDRGGIALLHIDRLYVDAAVEAMELEQIGAAREEVSGMVEAENAVIAELAAALG